MELSLGESLEFRLKPVCVGARRTGLEPEQADRVRQGHLATLAALREAALVASADRAPGETFPRYLRALDQDGALCAVLVLDADALRIGRGFVRPPAGDGPGTTQLTPAPDDRKTTPE